MKKFGSELVSPREAALDIIAFILILPALIGVFLFIVSLFGSDEVSKLSKNLETGFWFGDLIVSKGRDEFGRDLPGGQEQLICPRFLYFWA
jgi:hypothetical protein